MTDASYVLVVDDEPSICWGFEQMLGDEGHQVITASSAEEGLQRASEHDYSLVLLDVRLPGEDGISALPKFRAATHDAPVVVMTAFGDLETAVGAVKNGASDYLTKPFKLEDAAKMCRQAMRKRQPSSDDTSDQPDDNIVETDASMLVGRSAAMQQVFRQIALVADSELSVLITGETGTGKELVASAIHRHSRRSDEAYLPIAPVTLNESVIESELFGHVKGAFTGAADDRQGLFELANGGTVLLDEIGDLPMAAQVKLLRVLEQGEFTAVGDVRSRKCDVRVIAATNRDLQDAVDAGTFREDLLYRLAAVSIRLPPLRTRVEDIPPLCEFFLRRLGYPSAAGAIDAQLMQELQNRHWAGNVRELRNAVEHASVVARGRALQWSDFPDPQIDRTSVKAAAGDSMDEVLETWTRKQLATAKEDVTDLHEKFLSAVEPALLRVALQHTGGNRAAAAELLGIHRGTLRERMKKYDVE
ncbi:MAG: sigma-54-dependent Fis family transcriptional regulator [Pirellulaceae bacterium]|nr:sigma-54-dependent Fis family transcriptional regulator [Pirellulaceae bacterium]